MAKWAEINLIMCWDNTSPVYKLLLHRRNSPIRLRSRDFREPKGCLVRGRQTHGSHMFPLLGHNSHSTGLSVAVGSPQ